MREVGSLQTGTNTVTGSGLDVLTGLNTPVAVRVYGEDPQVLAAEAAKVQQLMSTIDGVVDPRVEGAPTQPTIEIEVDLDKAQQLGITPGAVRRAEATLLQGIQVGSVFEDQKVFDVIVLERLPREAAWRLCSRCSSIGQAAAISGWAMLPR